MTRLVGVVSVATLLAVSVVCAQDTTTQADTIRDANKGTLDEFLARAECRTSLPDSASDVIHAAALGSSDVNPEFFCFAIDSTIYGMNVHGEGVTLEVHRTRRAFRIRVPADWIIEGLMYHRYKNTLYVFYELGNGGCGYGQLDALRIPSLRPGWVRALQTTFNLSPVLLADTVAYLSSLDFVAKVDLRRGSVVWRHMLDVRGLRGGRHYESFYAPHRLKSLIYFPENPHDLFEKHRADTVVVDDMTGRIVSPAGLKTVPIHGDFKPSPKADCS